MISVSNIVKTFKLYQSPADRLKEIILRRCYHREFHALKNVSFEVREGETLGIVGQNGAGKSTLLKILTGILMPDRGAIHIKGRITGLLELGTGFNQEFSGLENIFLNGTYLGLSRREIEERLEKIIAFTELGDFIREPLKTYSSGMVMRLAFSVAIHADPKVFVVDEALSVGDAYFQQKCMRKIKEFKNNGGSIVFVSHDMNAVKVLCDTAILIDNGLRVDYGKPKDIIDFYQSIILKKSHIGDLPIEINNKEKIIVNDKSEGMKVGTGEVKLVSFKIYNGNDEEISYIESENVLKIVFEVRALRDIKDPHYGVQIVNRLGVSAFETNSYCMNIKNESLQKGEKVKVAFIYDFNLFPGSYSINIGVMASGFGEGSFEEYLLYLIDVEIIKVIKNSDSILYSGQYNMKPKFIAEKKISEGLMK